MSVRGLRKVYGSGPMAVAAVDGIDLDLIPGQILLVMGPSGSGKTTLLLMLGALLRPTEGSILIGDLDLATTPSRRLPQLRARTLGFVFQDFNLIPSLNAEENVTLAANLAGVTGAEAGKRARAVLDRVGLSARLNFRPDQLSGGEKQRVAVARALVNNPILLLADEPTANLDSGTGREVARRLRELATHDGRSVVIVSHDERLREIADRTLWLEDGRLRDLDALVTDPICGMSVQPGSGPHVVDNATIVWFCSTGCRDEYAGRLSRLLA
ncbi:ABC transporter ATP-binding protein [[Actinomadura] parvosata subsp. kistnae]|uniref:ABC transporter ATP-binding protein n=1 Tax=[Actinomadura] parvosata subsp. kistnae TaxID=1909395 RepID=A0A1U9ZYT5_9ACTN|nr:ABC transporter ATP-binding protein [Nonomuraea sp. ATCC 55076]